MYLHDIKDNNIVDRNNANLLKRINLIASFPRINPIIG